LHAFDHNGLDLDLGLNRDGGLTHVLDKGLGPRGWEDVLEMSGDYIDIIKLGWGTAYVTKQLERKLQVLKEKPVVIGGTFFEVVYVRGALDDYKRWLTGLGLTHVEISDGTVEIPRERKLELIADFARDFTVLSEVGSKDSDVVYAPYQWVEWIKEEKAAGATSPDRLLTKADPAPQTVYRIARGRNSPFIVALPLGPDGSSQQSSSIGSSAEVRGASSERLSERLGTFESQSDTLHRAAEALIEGGRYAGSGHRWVGFYR